MTALSLGTALAAGSRQSRPPAGSAPAAVSPPVLSGEGRIGEPLAATAGRWTGNPLPIVTLHWQRDGHDLPGVTGPSYVPGAADDGARLRVRAAAKNPHGSAEGFSNRVPVVFKQPSLVGGLPDLLLPLHSGAHEMDASSVFSGSSLTFAVTGDGVEIDPATGLLRIFTDALRDGITVTVTAANSGGETQAAFTLTVIEADPGEPVPGEEPPVMVTAPALSGEARIGTAVAVAPGEWSGQPAPTLALQWLIDGAAIDGATAAEYVPVAADDGKALACRLTATNPAGTAEAVAGPRTVAHVAPTAKGGLADLVLEAGSGPATVEAGADFTGAALVFAVAGAGATIDAATGRLTLATDTLIEAETITVTATNSGGTAESAFRLTVVAAVPDKTPPALVAAPALSGEARIGTAVAVEPGEWSGQPSPTLALQWLIDGAAIDGATAASYVPVAAADGKALACRVTATNPAGIAEAETAALGITYAPPQATGALGDKVFEAGTGAQAVPTAAAFAGAALVFTVAGAGATVDAATGVVAIPTDAPLAGETVTVTASNSGGSASLAFLVTVEAARTEAEIVLQAGEEPVAGANVFVANAPGDPGRWQWWTTLAAADLPAGTQLRKWAWSGTPPAPTLSNTSPVDLAVDGTPSVRRSNGTRAIGSDLNIRIYLYHEGARTFTEVAAGAMRMREVAAAPGDPLPLAPVLLAPPVLTGTGRIGTPVAVDPGQWSGDPVLALQWCRNGAAIPGADKPSYTPVAADDRAALTCRVRATNAAGATEAETAALGVTHVPPQATGELFDEVFDQGTGAQAVPTAAAFTGAALVFTVAGAGATIDAATGVVAIATDIPLSGETITVTATNSGGSASLAFLVTVEAIDGETDGETEIVLQAGEEPVPGANAFVVNAPGDPGRWEWWTTLAATDLPAGTQLRKWAWSGTPPTPTLSNTSLIDFAEDGDPSPRRSNGTRPLGSDLNIRIFLYDEVAQTFTEVAAGSLLVKAVTSDPGESDPGSEQPGEPGTPPGNWPSLNTAAIQNAEGRTRRLEHGHANSNWWGSFSSHADLGPVCVTLAIGALNGRQSSKDRLKWHLEYMLSGREPLCMAGYLEQHSVLTYAAILMTKTGLPDVWSSLTSAQRTHANLVMECALACNAWITSDRNPAFTGSGSYRDLRGGTNLNRNWARNYQAGQYGGLIVAAWYMGPAAAQSFLDSYSHTAMRSKLSSHNVPNLKNTWNASGTGVPTVSQIDTALRGYRHDGHALNNAWHQIFMRRLAMMADKQAHYGLTWNGVVDAGVPYSGVRHALVLGSKSGHPVYNQMGMFNEMQSGDGLNRTPKPDGGPSNYNGRSNMKYCLDGARAWNAIVAAGLVSGYVTKNLSGAGFTMSQLNQRMKVGWADHMFKLGRGYRDIRGGAPSGTWTQSEKFDQYGYIYTPRIWTDFVAPRLEA